MTNDGFFYFVIRNSSINIRYSLLLLLFFTAVLGGCDRPAGKNTPLRIMPLGDSITQADDRHSSYRFPLWNMLREHDYEVDFVGSLKNNYKGRNPAQGFDQDHEGHWGWRADQIITGIPGQGSIKEFIQLHMPDIVLMHLGSNDVFQGESTDEIVDDLKQLIHIIRAANPDVIILVARILPVANDAVNRRILLLNEAVSKLPSDLEFSSHVIVVNQHDGFDARTDTYDGVHPNNQGQLKMADKWFDALREVMVHSTAP